MTAIAARVGRPGRPGRGHAAMFRRDLLRPRRYPTRLRRQDPAGDPGPVRLRLRWCLRGRRGAGRLRRRGRPRGLPRLHRPCGPALRGRVAPARASRSPPRWTPPSGIMARFRTMSVSSARCSAGRCSARSYRRSLAFAVVVVAAVALGYRPGRRPADWWRSRAARAGRGRARPGCASPWAWPPGRWRARQHADAVHRPALPRQRVRAGGDDARRGAVVRGVPAVHTDHRDRCGASWRRARRPLDDGPGRRLVHGNRGWSATPGRGRCTAASGADRHEQMPRGNRRRCRQPMRGRPPGAGTGAGARAGPARWRG